MLVSEWMCRVIFIHWLIIANPGGSEKWSDCPRLLIYLLAIWIIKLNFFSLASKSMLFPVPRTNSKDWHPYMFFTNLHPLTRLAQHAQQRLVLHLCAVFIPHLLCFSFFRPVSNKILSWDPGIGSLRHLFLLLLPTRWLAYRLYSKRAVGPSCGSDYGQHSMAFYYMWDVLCACSIFLDSCNRPGHVKNKTKNNNKKKIWDSERLS